MIRVDQTLCAGCGVCMDECTAEAITLVDGITLVDAALCDGCGSFDEAHGKVCIDVCPNGALTWVGKTVPELGTAPSSLAVVPSPVKVISVEPREAVPWRRTMLPAVGSALIWIRREVVPRLATLALDVLDGALDRRLSRWARNEAPTPISTMSRRGLRRRRRRRHRQGRPQK